jgi:acyl dehydratase
LKGDSYDVVPFARKLTTLQAPGVPTLDPDRVVHGEQYFEVLAPLPVEGDLEIHNKISGLWDTGKGMIMDQESTLVDPKTGKSYAKMITSLFYIGGGNFGGKKKPDQPYMITTPKRVPDATVEQKTLPTQHLIYRLSSDYNPLHIDPRIGERLKMKGVILHGLCTFAHSTSAILQEYGGNDQSALKTIYGRFVSPVYPGETLITEIWKMKQENGVVTVAFQTKVKERNAIVISGGSATVLVLQKSKL